ncbi:MAG: IPTL-CTERM sorting domain-containing protein [Planctomycetota bacterium]
MVILLALTTMASLSWAGPLDGREAVDDVFYQIMPISWRDSDNDQPYRFGDFEGMSDSIPYLLDLGITAVWINPINEAITSHGYQGGAKNTVNDRFGTMPGFLSFVEQAHASGIKVFIDIEMYDVGASWEWFQDAYANPSSPYSDWLAFTNAAQTDWWGGQNYTDFDGTTFDFIHWNLNHPDAKALVTGWAKYWLDPDGNGDPSDGVDGFRCDHVWVQYPNGPNGWGYNLGDFWEPWKDELLAVNPEVFVMCEQADWGSYGAELLTAFDAAFTKPFEFAARDALSSESAGPLYNSMAGTLGSLPSNRLYLTTIGNHDVPRLATTIGDNFEKGKAAAAVLLTQPLPPVIYNGDEIGMKSNFIMNWNISHREPFKWNAVAGPPMSDYLLLSPQHYAATESEDNDGRSVEEQFGTPGSLLEEYRKLIAVRKDHAALRRGTYHALPNSSTRIWSFLRHLEGEQSLLVAINLRGLPISTQIDLSGVDLEGGSTSVTDVITGQLLADLTSANQDAYDLTLPAYGYHVLAMDVSPQEPPLQIVNGLDITSDLGPPVLEATQDNATGMGDNVNELNQMFVAVNDPVLRVGLTGNLSTDGTGMALFIDSELGGQGTLDTGVFNPPPGGIPYLSGLTFDPGFAADYIVYVNAFSGAIYVDLYELWTGGGGEKRYIGQGTVNDLDGMLEGADNPNGMLVALNNSNVAGVTSTDASNAATATSGFEMEIPFADVGILAPAGQVKMLVLLTSDTGSVGNQLLPGLGGGYDNLGPTPINLANIPGQQFALIALASIPGDWNGDGLVDADDVVEFQNCYSGPDNFPAPPGCLLMDLDDDLDVDCDDWLILTVNWTGPPEEPPAILQCSIGEDIPALSEWGLLVMALLIVAAGAGIFAGRRAVI